MTSVLDNGRGWQPMAAAGAPQEAGRPRCTETPSCAGLLGDAGDVLGNRDRWPRHICISIMRESTRRWALAQQWASPEYVSEDVEAWRSFLEDMEAEARWPEPSGTREFALITHPTPDDVKRHRGAFDGLAIVRRCMASIWSWWPGHWPLPVGRAAFRREQAAFKGYSGEAILPVLSALPFDRDEEALLALTISLQGGSELELFALGVRQDDEAGGFSYYCGPFAYRARGQGGGAAGFRVLRDAEEWLSRFNGVRTGPVMVRRRGRRRRVIVGLDPEASRQRCLEAADLFEKGFLIWQLAIRYDSPESTVRKWVGWGKEFKADPSL